MQGLTAELSSGAPLSMPSLVIALALGLILAVTLRWHFERFGSTLSNRTEFAQVFPFITMTTILIITVVKSSLALSLGLVGALSIVRFRTPIKEPEELAYLFMAIAIGLGLGADQLVPTVISAVIILTAVAVLRWRREGMEPKNLYLSIDCPVGEGQQNPLNGIEEIFRPFVSSGDLRRVDQRHGSLEATYWVDMQDSTRLAEMIDALETAYPGIGVTFIDQQRVPAV